jgi:hypothetical protein
MTKTERLAHVQAWRSSGLTRPVYCREQGLNYGTFMSWCKLVEAPAPPVGKFVVLPSPAEVEDSVEIIFANGIRLHYRGVLSRELIQYLQHA